MEFLTELWLPIILSAVFVFIASSIIHMALPIHKGDYKKMNNEDAVMEVIRDKGVEVGEYMFPCAGSMKEMSSPEMVEKLKRGPVGWLTVLPARGCNMGKSLVLWFINCIIVGILVSYTGWYSLGAGAEYLTVFRIVGAASILGYVLGYMHEVTWKGASWKCTVKFMFDGVVYALVTAGTFAWLWPELTMNNLPVG